MTDIFCRFKKVPYICTRNQNKNKKKRYSNEKDIPTLEQKEKKQTRFP